MMQRDAEEEDRSDALQRLQQENEALKREIEEMRTEMDEMHDAFYEEDTCRLHELRRELERANKNCRILQYRVRKAERRHLHYTPSAEVDEELLRSLEQDLKVAKDVSVRLHHELKNVEEKRSRTEEENEKLREKLVQLEVHKQVLQNEVDQSREVQKRRGSKEFQRSDSHTLSEQGNEDLRCELSFVKEEAAIMLKKMAWLDKEKDQAEQQLQKYRSFYGDFDNLQFKGEAVGPPTTRQSGLKLRLRLVEEEASMLGRKIVELELENRSLRAELENMTGGTDLPLRGATAVSQEAGLYELREQLQLVEEEAELLRRNLADAEEQNKKATSELKKLRFKEGLRPRLGGVASSSEGRASSIEGGASPSSAVMEMLREELKAARLQVNELSGKVMQLQYEKRVMLSNQSDGGARERREECKGTAGGGGGGGGSSEETQKEEDKEEEKDGEVRGQGMQAAKEVGEEEDGGERGGADEKVTGEDGRKGGKHGRIVGLGREVDFNGGRAETEKRDHASSSSLFSPQQRREGPVGGESEEAPPLPVSAPPLLPRSPRERQQVTEIRAEAEHLIHTIELLIAHTRAFAGDASGGTEDGAADADEDDGVRIRERQLLHRIGSQMNEFRDELQGFMGFIERLEGGRREETHSEDRLPNCRRLASQESGDGRT